MTRINCVPVEELTREHLIAEYRELPRVSGLIWKWYNKTHAKILGMDVFVSPVAPKAYTMGKGHVKFFYDKGEWLRKRFEEEIVPEMQRRGYTTNHTKYRLHPEGYNLNWEPNHEAISISRQRIEERLGVK